MRQGRGQPVLRRGDHPHARRGGLLWLRGDGSARLTRPVDEIRMPGTVAGGDRRAPRSPRAGGEARRAGRRRARPPVPPRPADRSCSRGEGIDVARELEELEHRGIMHRKSVLSDDEYPLRREPDAGGRLRGPAAARAPPAARPHRRCCSKRSPGESDGRALGPAGAPLRAQRRPRARRSRPCCARRPTPSACRRSGPRAGSTAPPGPWRPQPWRRTRTTRSAIRRCRPRSASAT